MTQSVLIVENDAGELETYDEMPVGFAAMLLGRHAAHGGMFFMPECDECQARWPNGRGWGEETR